MNQEIKIKAEWERYQAMLDVEKRILKSSIDKLSNCLTPKLKKIHRDEIISSRKLIKYLKVLIREMKNSNIFNYGKVQNKSLNRVQREMEKKLYLKEVYDKTLEDLEVVPISEDSEGEFSLLEGNG